MNRRIRKKRLDAADRLLADGIRLYADRPTSRSDGEKWEALALRLLSLTVGLGLRERVRRLPGPFFGAEVDPPRAVAAEMSGPSTMVVNGLLLIRDRAGEAERAFLTFRLNAEKRRERWAMTRVLLSDASREMWEQAI